MNAEGVLRRLGITKPSEIDVEAIAEALGAKVRYRTLSCSHARIVALGNRAIISIDDAAGPQRRRFSVAHELGHWMLHRGQQLACAPMIDGSLVQDDSRSYEREADAFAASLLMPASMLRSNDAEPITALGVQQVARLFDVSLIAAATRLVELTSTACALAVANGDACWFRRSKAMPAGWFMPPVKLQQLLHASDGLSLSSVKVPALKWYVGPELYGRKIIENWLERRPDAAIVLLNACI